MEAKTNSKSRGPRPGKEKLTSLLKLNREWRKEEKTERRKEKKQNLRNKKAGVKKNAESDDDLPNGWDEVGSTTIFKDFRFIKDLHSKIFSAFI